MNIYKEMFTTDERVHKILNTLGKVEPRQILLALEMYEFVPKDKIISELNKVSNDAVFVNIPDAEDVEGTEFEVIETLGGVVSDIGEDSIVVCLDYFTKVDLNKIQMAMSKYRVTFRYITPLTYELIRNGYEYLYDNYEPVPLFQRIVMEALELGCTDIHFNVPHVDMQPRYYIQYRQQNDLITSNLFHFDEKTYCGIIKKIIDKKTNTLGEDTDAPEGVVTSYADPLGTGELELRISAQKCVDGRTLVARLQKKSTVSLEIDELGFDESITATLHKFAMKKSGLTLIGGAIRSGKNTTAFAIANELIKRPLKLIDYSSPIETLMPFTQVDYKGVPELLANYIRLAKKQDIDVAFLNEIPDKAVAFGVKDLINSSIGVVTTMHIDRLWHFVYKLKEYYGDDFVDMLPQLNGVINQKMFVKQCLHCREVFSVAELSKDIRDFCAENKVNSYSKTKGCVKCGNTGKQKGVQPYAEVLYLDQNLKSEILRCDKAYKMEDVVKSALIRTRGTLECKIAEAVENGDLPYTAILELI